MLGLHTVFLDVNKNIELAERAIVFDTSSDMNNMHIFSNKKTVLQTCFASWPLKMEVKSCPVIKLVTCLKHRHQI